MTDPHPTSLQDYSGIERRLQSDMSIFYSAHARMIDALTKASEFIFTKIPKQFRYPFVKQGLASNIWADLQRVSATHEGGSINSQLQRASQLGAAGFLWEFHTWQDARGESHSAYVWRRQSDGAIIDPHELGLNIAYAPQSTYRGRAN